MATYDVVLELADGHKASLRVDDASSAFGAIGEAGFRYLKGGRAKLVAKPCEKCLDSGIELEPILDSISGRRGRLICDCEWGKGLLEDRGPDNYARDDPDETLDEAEVGFESAASNG